MSSQSMGKLGTGLDAWSRYSKFTLQIVYGLFVDHVITDNYVQFNVHAHSWHWCKTSTGHASGKMLKLEGDIDDT